MAPLFWLRKSNMMSSGLRAACAIGIGFVGNFLPPCVADDGFTKELRPVLDRECFRCHNAEKQKGGVDLARFEDELAVVKGYKVWRRALEQLETGEMPPEDDKLTDAERSRVIAGLRKSLALLDSDHPSIVDPGPALIRRLSRVEYNNVIRDLTGLEFNIQDAVGMPEDSTGSSFENIAAALAVAPTLMEKYFTAADIILGRLFGEPVNSATSDGKSRPPDSKKDKAASAAFFAGPGAQPERDSALALLETFARRAYRRPLGDGELGRFAMLYDKAVANGEDSRSALRKAMKPTLVSPFFLFRIEQPGMPAPVVAGARPAMKVSDIELASRLSFFLWSSIPDDELMRAAESGELSKPAILQAQVSRMLADPKARALAENFFVSWLQVRKLEEARPATEFFPTFNGRMKAAMRDEVIAFCDNLRTGDRAFFDLLDADYAFVTPELARHYGLPEVGGKDIQKVVLKPQDHRGGILGMGAVLAATSHTNRTSPSQRGRWVLDVVFGTPPPPPPANAGMFKDEGRKQKEPKDFREKLAQHAEDPTCAGCHRRMDPLGFGLDNYDAVGRWRPTSPELNTSGELPGGGKFSGAAELKNIIWNRREQFARNFIGQLLSYALGREIDYFDEGQITRIRSRAAADSDRFSAVIQGIVTSYPFQYRRDADPVPESSAPATASN